MYPCDGWIHQMMRIIVFLFHLASFLFRFSVIICSSVHARTRWDVCNACHIFRFRHKRTNAITSAYRRRMREHLFVYRYFLHSQPSFCSLDFFATHLCKSKVSSHHWKLITNKCSINNFNCAILSNESNWQNQPENMWAVIFEFWNLTFSNSSTGWFIADMWTCTNMLRWLTVNQIKFNKEKETVTAHRFCSFWVRSEKANTSAHWLHAFACNLKEQSSARFC